LDTTPDAQRGQRQAELTSVSSPEGLDSGMPDELPGGERPAIEPAYDTYDDELAAELEVGLIDEVPGLEAANDHLVQVPPNRNGFHDGYPPREQGKAGTEQEGRGHFG